MPKKKNWVHVGVEQICSLKAAQSAGYTMLVNIEIH